MINTDSYFINLGSMTFSMRAENILKNGGMECTVGKSSEHRTSNGCSWGVYVKKDTKEKALNLLRLNGLFV